MFKSIASVGGFTLVSRLTGFVRDVVMAAVMGTGLMADAFVVAQRLPNHFRAIFGEGAFDAAFVPAIHARWRARAAPPPSSSPGVCSPFCWLC
jgi:putative peptidoglycan lipid II flippase